MAWSQLQGWGELQVYGYTVEASVSTGGMAAMDTLE